MPPLSVSANTSMYSSDSLLPSRSSTSAPGSDPGLPLRRQGVVVRAWDKPKHPPLGKSLCQKQEVSEHYCRTGAGFGDMSCGLFPQQAFYAAFKQASYILLLTHEKTCTKQALQKFQQLSFIHGRRRALFSQQMQAEPSILAVT